jgi:hypothetical protein
MPRDGTDLGPLTPAGAQGEEEEIPRSFCEFGLREAVFLRRNTIASCAEKLKPTATMPPATLIPSERSVVHLEVAA